jgi:coproporphyrinogen III oxidase
MKNLEISKKKFSEYVRELQDQITNKMKSLDSSLVVTEDNWQRQDHHSRPGGGGRTRYHQGKIFEAAGVNTSEVYGSIDPKFSQTLNGTGDELWATGISLIIHPLNPRVPTVHANFRMIHQGQKVWFGGGADLTPFYPHKEDFDYFHGVWKAACAPSNTYEMMKNECDKYFINHHRGDEMRGVSGIFFDHYNTGDLVNDMEMVMFLGNHFIKSYFPIVEKRMNESWTQEDEDFQLHRRGRYVEFNLLHDRGTLFGLKTKGRTESILISLPPRCKFSYNYSPAKGSVHEQMMKYYFVEDKK